VTISSDVQTAMIKMLCKTKIFNQTYSEVLAILSPSVFTSLTATELPV